MPTPRVFVSHSHLDHAFTQRLVSDLRAAGAKVWVSESDIHSGVFANVINDALRQAEWVILVLSPNAIASPWVKEEIAAAQALANQNALRGIIPIIAAPFDLATLPALWNAWHRYDATTDYRVGLTGLLNAIGAPNKDAVIAAAPATLALPSAPATAGKPQALPHRPKWLWPTISAAISLIVIASLVIASVSGPLHGLAQRLFHFPGAAAHSAGPPAAPDAAQVLHAGLSSFDTVDPQQTLSIGGYEIAQVIFPGLIQLDAQLRPIPWAASKVAVSTDGLTYTFTLRANLAWSDGTPITAADFAYSIDHALNPCTAAGAASFLYPILHASDFNKEQCGPDGTAAPVASLINDALVVVDPHTLNIKLAQPAAYFLTALSFPVSFAIPRQLVHTYGKQWAQHLTDQGGLGGNLFKLVGLDIVGQNATAITLARNDHFWGTKAKLRQIIFTRYASDDAMYNAYLTGTGDVSAVGLADYASAHRSPGFNETGQLTMFYLAMDWTKPPFNDLHMRQAFALAINKTKLASDVTGGTAEPTNHLVPDGIPGYNPALLGPDGTANLDGNAQSAAALAQGYAALNCNGDLRQCAPVTLTVPQNKQSNWATLAAEIAVMWRNAMPGYPITIKTTPVVDLANQGQAGKLQCWALAWAADYPDPQDWLSLQFLPNGGNWGHADVAGANSLMQQADGELNTQLRMQKYNQAEQLLVTNVAWVPLYQPKLPYVVRTSVSGYHLTDMEVPSVDIWQSVYLAQT